MEMVNQKPHICVCICTYKRPEMLLELLSKIEKQETENLFDYSIVIVDNDKLESARQSVESYAQHSQLQIRYFIEIEQNISIARNKAFEKSMGDFIAMIDDDEYPSETWLLALYKTFIKYNATGAVLGPVIAFYPDGTPSWLIKSKICERLNYQTGTKLDWNMTRGGNVLLLRKMFDDASLRFDPKLGRNGGEDKELFKRIIERGYSFIWCGEAEVYEVVYPGRWKLSHYLYRSLLNGGDNGRDHGRGSFSYLVRTSISFICYSILFILTIFIGKHHSYKYLIRVVYDFARIMGCFNIAFIKVRYD